MKRWILCLIVFGLSFLTGCSMDKFILLEAEQLPNKVAETEKFLSIVRVDYDTAISASKIPNLAGITTREKLAENFNKADASMKRGKRIASEVAELAKQNRHADEAVTKAKIANCKRTLTEVKQLASIPGERLWEWEGIFANAKPRSAVATKRVEEMNHEIDANLVGKGPVKLRVQVQSKSYPNKEKDLTARVDDIFKTKEELNGFLKTVQTQSALIEHGSAETDIVVLLNALDNVDETVEVITMALEDLKEKLEELDETYETVLIRLQKIPTFKIHLSKWNWGSEEYGDGTETALGWQDVSEDEWFSEQYAEDVVVESSGSEFYSGSSTEVSDKDIIYRYLATTFERKNGQEGEPIESEIEEELYEDYLEIVRKLHALFPDNGVIGREESSNHMDPEDNESIRQDLQVRVVTEMKVPGQYEEEANDSPSPDGVPLGLVGNPEYGQWQNGMDGVQTWHWHDYMLGHFHSHHVFITYWNPYPYSLYSPYSSWRREIGYGNCYDIFGNYTCRGAHTRGMYRSAYRTSRDTNMSPNSARGIRGAGPGARARGAGGGGK